MPYKTLADARGPNGAVNDRIAVFDGTTGKLLKDGGYTIAGLPSGGSGSGGIGSYSAIVYVVSTAIYAKDAAGTTLSGGSGTYNTDDDTIIQVAIDYVYGLGGGTVKIRRPASTGIYKLDATVICKLNVSMDIEADTIFRPTTNNIMFQLFPNSGVGCATGRCVLDSTQLSGWNSTQMLLEGGAVGAAGFAWEGHEGHIFGVNFLGLERTAASGVGLKLSSALSNDQWDNEVSSVVVERCNFFGFDTSIKLYCAPSGTAIFVNGNWFRECWISNYKTGISLEGCCQGNIFENIIYQQPSYATYRVMEISISNGQYNKFNVFIWDNQNYIDTIHIDDGSGYSEYNIIDGCGVFAESTNVSDELTNIIRNPIVEHDAKIVYSDTVGGLYVMKSYLDVLVVDTTGGAITVRLPPIKNHIERNITVVKYTTSANAVTIEGTNYEQVDFDDTATLPGNSKGKVTFRPITANSVAEWIST